MIEENEHGTDACARDGGLDAALKRRGVPVAMGSGGSRSLRAGGLTVTHAWFPAGTLLDRHTHDDPVLAVMLAGGFDLTISGRRTSCTPATVFTEPAGESHSNLVGRAGAVVVVVQPQGGRELPRACACALDSISHFQDGRMATLGRRIAHEFDAGDDLGALGIEGLALELMAFAGRRHSASCAAAPAWLERIEAMINDRFLGRLRIDELAREADLHPAHLARAFRIHYHVSIAAYIRTLRLEWAAVRLATTDDSLSTIAHRSGFADQSHFTRAFRVHAGMPPGEYRRIRRTPARCRAGRALTHRAETLSVAGPGAGSAPAAGGRYRP